jgi:hypothetical protein
MNWNRALTLYIGTSSSYGFYRGWNHLYNWRDFKEPSPIYMDRVVTGMGGAFLQLHPFSVFFTLRRAEKHLRGLSLTQEDYSW